MRKAPRSLGTIVEIYPYFYHKIHFFKRKDLLFRFALQEIEFSKTNVKKQTFFTESSVSQSKRSLNEPQEQMKKATEPSGVQQPYYSFHQRKG